MNISHWFRFNATQFVGPPNQTIQKISLGLAKNFFVFFAKASRKKENSSLLLKKKLVFVWFSFRCWSRNLVYLLPCQQQCEFIPFVIWIEGWWVRSNIQSAFDAFVFIWFFRASARPSPFTYRSPIHWVFSATITTTTTERLHFGSFTIHTFLVFPRH